MNSSAMRNIILYMLIVVTVIMVYNYIRSGASHTKPLNFTEFTQQVEAGNVTKVKVKGVEASGEFKEPVDNMPRFKTTLPEDIFNYTETLVAKGIEVQVTPSKSGQGGWLLLNILFMVALVFGIYWIFIRQMQNSGNKAMAFGKSRARLVSSKDRVTFRDVAGMEEVKEEVQEVIEYLKEPQKFQKLGGTIPKGVLLMGSPGTGKTLLAKAIAGEANVPFFSISGSEFVELFVGVGASRVRDTFEQGKKNAPCLIFIDEIDAVGRSRGVAVGGGHEEREQTLNQLLVEMDGFDSNEGIIVLAATNRPDVLDPALLRPGRFDRRIHIPRPDLNGREAILKVHTRKVPMSDTVDLHTVARGTPGFSGADLRNLVNEAALRAARFNKDAVESEDFEYAKDKVLMGVERPSMVVSPQERHKVAYHEAGHAVAGWFMKNADPVHKITIIPRGAALGVTQSLPVEDSLSYSKEYLEARLVTLMGGRAAEELFLGTVTTGAGNDLEQATEIARNMVTRWGMSEKVGPLAFNDQNTDPFSFETHRGTPYAAEMGDLIDQEVRSILDTAYSTTLQLLEKQKEKTEVLAEALLEKETLDRDEIVQILGVRPEGSREMAPAPPAHPPTSETEEEEAEAQSKKDEAPGFMGPVPEGS